MSTSFSTPFSVKTLVVDHGSEERLVESLQAALAQATQPLEQAVLRVMLDVMPDLPRALAREAPTLDPIEIPSFAASVMDTLLDHVCSGLSGHLPRSRRALTSLVIMSSLARLKKESLS